MNFTKEIPKKRGIYYVRQTKQSRIYMAHMYKQHGVWWAEMGPNDECTYAFGLSGPKFLHKEVMFFRSEKTITIGI